MFLRLDVVDARDIEEMILVIVRQETFHLRRVHAAVGLADVDHREVQRGENIDGHLPNRQEPAQADANQRNHHGQRASQCKEDKVHKPHAVDRGAPLWWCNKYANDGIQ